MIPAAGSLPSVVDKSAADKGAADKMRIGMERHSQRLITAFVVSGVLYLLLPGTFLGVWNLIGISRQHAPGSISPAWLQAHGHAQVFGWVGSFILGIGFYSLTKMQSSLTFPARAGWTAWSLWTLGVALRWIGGVTGYEWRILLPLSGLLELIAFALFYWSIRRHRSPVHRTETWMLLVMAATIAFALVLILNFASTVYVAMDGGSPALPHVFDQLVVLFAIWGVLVPTIWGFNARWLPIFAGFGKPRRRGLFAAYGLSILGLAAACIGWLVVSAAALFLSGLLAIDALRVWEPAVQPAKLLNVHRSFPLFLRIAYIWLLISSVLYALAVLYDRSGGIWGASRHALTVGYVGGMVFAIGQRVLPAFCGMRVLWSKKLMLWSLLLLHAGCMLRVPLEPLAYGNHWGFAWKLLPWSAMLELAAVALFASNILGTLLRPPAHLRPVIYSVDRIRHSA